MGRISIELLFLLEIICLILVGCNSYNNNGQASTISRAVTDSPSSATKLYWFIPDGMRADPNLFNVFKWAEEGKLPNIKIMMDNGAYGYSIPTFPSHTPTNFATLFTGAYPEVHGVADGPMRVEGQPLDKVAVGGFSSVAKKVPPIWYTLEKNGKNVVLLSMPGSTPPELDKGIIIRGRWGGWGADFHAVNFQSEDDLSKRKEQGRGTRLFFFGPELTKYIGVSEANNWSSRPLSYSVPLEAELEAWGTSLYAYIYDTTDDSKVNYNEIFFSPDKKTKLTSLEKGEWSEWFPIKLNWKGMEIESDVIINAIKLEDDGFFRVRLVYNNLNSFITQPSRVADELTDGIGPMVDFVDNFPAQLVYYPEDKKTFLEEMAMSSAWHTKAIPFIIKYYQPDVFIYGPYNPNQMLTSRWWMGYIDPLSSRYNEVSEKERQQIWKEVEDMYTVLDNMIGETIKNADKNTLIVLSSDHGVVPLNKWVRLNNLFAKEGLLKFALNENTGEPIIDWAGTKVIYLQMDNIYINPEGLSGNWSRASGNEYEKLRDKVIEMLLKLEDENGVKPVKAVVKWENVKDYLHLPPDRVGDLIVANEAGYGWYEEMTDDLEIFSKPLITGYKQAILSEEEKGMWTPFIIMGHGVKKGYQIKKPIQMVDQYPTIMTLLNIDIPDFVQGSTIKEIMT